MRYLVVVAAAQTPQHVLSTRVPHGPLRPRASRCEHQIHIVSRGERRALRLSRGWPEANGATRTLLVAVEEVSQALQNAFGCRRRRWCRRQRRQRGRTVGFIAADVSENPRAVVGDPGVDAGSGGLGAAVAPGCYADDDRPAAGLVRVTKERPAWCEEGGGGSGEGAVRVGRTAVCCGFHYPATIYYTNDYTTADAPLQLHLRTILPRNLNHRSTRQLRPSTCPRTSAGLG